MKLAKWLIRIGCALLVVGAAMHLYGYTFTDRSFAGSNVQPQVIAAYRTLFLAFAAPPLCLVPIFLWAMRMPGGKKNSAGRSADPSGGRRADGSLSGNVYRDGDDDDGDSAAGDWDFALERRSGRELESVRQEI